MTLEELKAEAKKQGYSLVKRPTYVPLKKCCNCQSKSHLRQFNDGFWKYWKCVKCGLTARGSSTDKKARENWNVAVQGGTDND